VEIERGLLECRDADRPTGLPGTTLFDGIDAGAA
jgi:hypothetical protein